MADLTAQQWGELEAVLSDGFIEVQSINRRHTAYGLKQKFSREHFYVTQEQFTEAMRRVGFKAERLDDGNACFNIGERSPYFK